MARKRKEVKFEVIDVFDPNGLTWDELGESILPIIEDMLNYFEALETCNGDKEKAEIMAKTMSRFCQKERKLI